MCLYERAPRPFSKHSHPNHWEIEGSSGHLSGRDVVLLAGEPDQPQAIRETVSRCRWRNRCWTTCTWRACPTYAGKNPYKAYGVGNLDDVAKSEILTNTHRAITTGSPVQYGPAGARADLETFLCHGREPAAGQYVG